MREIMTKAITKIFAVVYLTLIMNGSITSPDQIPGKVDKTDLQYLAGAAQIENGHNSEECIFGSSEYVSEKRSPSGFVIRRKLHDHSIAVFLFNKSSSEYFGCKPHMKDHGDQDKDYYEHGTGSEEYG